MKYGTLSDNQIKYNADQASFKNQAHQKKF